MPRPLSPGAQRAMGFLFVALGLVVAAIATYKTAQQPLALASPGWAGALAGLAFAFGGGLIVSIQSSSATARAVMMGLFITSLALAFDWIAFVPGERHFSGGFSAGGISVASNPGETAGRIFFGLFAVLFDVAAIGVWLRVLRPRKAE